MTPDPSSTSRRRGRPRTTGDAHCDRCSRSAGKLRTRWPEGGICGTCFHAAVRTTGTCPHCNHQGMLPGLDRGQPICRRCADIPTDLDCHRCGVEAEHYRRGGICARCALRDDLTALLAPTGTPTPAARRLLEVLASVDRPESVHTWKRRPAVQALLIGLGDGTLDLTHEAFDTADGGAAVEHLRDLMVHHGLLAHRDRDLARFEGWLRTRLEATEPAWSRQLLERYGRWHHIPAIRQHFARGASTQARVNLAKQEITEIGKLLTWLDGQDTTLADCSQAQLDRWITTGPTTRSVIRPFLGWARRHRLAATDLELARRVARHSPITTHAVRVDWLRRCLVDDHDTLTCRVAATLLLLYALPISRVVALRREQVVITPAGTTIMLGNEPADVPAPFAQLLRDHLAKSPDDQAADGGTDWVFPGIRAGQHLHPDTMLVRLRALGIDLRATRNAVLRDLVQQVPPPIVASQLGYSPNTVHRHAEQAAQPTEHYASLVIRP